MKIASELGLETRFHQRVRQKETRGSLHYRWNWSFSEDTTKGLEIKLNKARGLH